MGGLVTLLIIVAGVAVAWLTLMLIVALVEKQHAYELTEMASDDEVPATSYLQSMSEQAAAAGFIHTGDLRHVKHKIRLTLWISPDARTIAYVSGGKILNLNVKRTALLSRLTSGKVLMTHDETMLPDLTGLYARQLVLNGKFAELKQKHDVWLAQAGDMVAPFDNPPADEMRDIEVEDVTRQEAFGYSYYVDREAGTYRYTFKGAVKKAVFGLFSSMIETNRQRDRMNLRRPG